MKSKESLLHGLSPIIVIFPMLIHHRILWIVCGDYPLGKAFFGGGGGGNVILEGALSDNNQII